jgi:hypothetical protein
MQRHAAGDSKAQLRCMPAGLDLAALASTFESGAAFGATLYRVLVLFGAMACDVDNESKSFILQSLFSAVQGSASLCFELSNRT